jgi:glycerol-3-phosphate O-acyltransferase
MLALVRARKYLQRRFGSEFVNFGEPISLADALGERRARLAGGAPGAAAEQRAFVEQLGNRIAERINWAVVPNATAVAACALLGERRRGLFRAELAERMQQIVDLLRLQDVRLTPELARDEGSFAESIASIVRMDLVERVEDPRGEVLFFEESKRRALDFYRNSIIHYLAAPSFLARRLLSGPDGPELRRDVGEWLELFYREFFTPHGEVMAAHVDAFLDHFERHGWLDRGDGPLRATEKGRPVFRFLAEQTRAFVEAYACACAAVAAALPPDSDRPVGLESLREAVGEQFERAELLGEVDRREGANPVTFANALDLLVRRGVLAPAPQKAGREEEAFVRGEAFGDLPGLRERLALALPAR